NPGNLLRVLLVLTQTRSPWQHVVQDLEAWVFARYTERLGYHFTLIYSERQPPPTTNLEPTLQQFESEQSKKIQRDKINALAFMIGIGALLYLVFHWSHALLFFLPNWPLFVIATAPLLGCGLFGLFQLRSPKRWLHFWQSLRPQWTKYPPTYTHQDRAAIQQMQNVLAHYTQAPTIPALSEAKKLPAYYGKITWSMWEACFLTYKDPTETNPLRATREFYLPQAFAGIEQLAHDLQQWYNADTLIPQTLRQLEKWGVNLEWLYVWLKNRSTMTEEQKCQHNPSEIPILFSAPKTSDSASQSEWGGMLWQGLKQAGQKIGEMAKDLAITEAHQHILRKLRQHMLPRLIDIYGARYPAATFNTSFASKASPNRQDNEANSEYQDAPQHTSEHDHTQQDPSQDNKANTQESKIPAQDSEATAQESKRSSTDDKAPAQNKPPQQTEQVPSKDDEFTRITQKTNAQSNTHAPAPERAVSSNRSRILVLSRTPEQHSLLLQTLFPEISVFPDVAENEWVTLCSAPQAPFLVDLLQWQEQPKATHNTTHTEPQYDHILLIEEIDHGARGDIARRFQQNVHERLRRASHGPLSLLLTGVEKLKPLIWDPPYDDYRHQTPSSKKTKRIRNAVLAWKEAFATPHPLKDTEIFPIGIPKQGQPWGLDAVRSAL
ncbi:MAG: hypothetical protein AAGJ35_06515, partial [Myxococcota bacterium]